MLTKSTILYLGTFLLLVLGLWAILAAGQKLRAPFDLSGEWNLEKDTTLVHTISFDQSGRYLQMRFDRQPVQKVKWSGEQLDSEGEHIVHLKGVDQEIQVTSTPATKQGGRKFQFRFTGLVNGSWLGYRMPADGPQ